MSPDSRAPRAARSPALAPTLYGPRLDATTVADLDLARRASQRDEQAWNVLFAMARDLIYGAAWRYALEEEREDLLQDVMERLVRKIDSYRGESPLRVWIASICFNRLRNAYRSVLLEERFIDSNADVDRELSRSSNADARALRTGDHALVDAAMHALREPQRQVVILRLIAELSVDDAARRLAVPPGTIKSRLNRALADLRLFVLVLRGASLADAAARSGHALAVARLKLAAALPIWRRRLPRPLIIRLERRLFPEVAIVRSTAA